MYIYITQLGKPSRSRLGLKPWNGSAKKPQDGINVSLVVRLIDHGSAGYLLAIFIERCPRRSRT